jgi:hypothetical protein
MHAMKIDWVQMLKSMRFGFGIIMAVFLLCAAILVGFGLVKTYPFIGIPLVFTAFAICIGVIHYLLEKDSA